MKSSALGCLLLSVSLSLVSCEKNYKENDNSTVTLTEKSKDDSENGLDSKMSTRSSITENPHSHRQKLQFVITPDKKTSIHPVSDSVKSRAPGEDTSEFNIPDLGFTDGQNEKQNLFLVNDGEKYNVQLHSFLQPKPPHLNTAIGAISAHILSQRTNQEYIPYPPNGDPYNYPAYRGYSHATEPPAVRAYEEASNPNYGGQPPANFDQLSPRRIFLNNGYQQGFPNQFDNFGLNFYSNPNLFTESGYYARETGGPTYQDRFLYGQ